MSANISQITESNVKMSSDLDGARASQRLNEAAISAEPKRQPQPEPQALIDNMKEAVGKSRQNNQAIEGVVKEKPKLFEVKKGLQEMKQDNGVEQKGINNSPDDPSRGR